MHSNSTPTNDEILTVSNSRPASPAPTASQDVLQQQDFPPLRPEIDDRQSVVQNPWGTPSVTSPDRPSYAEVAARPATPHATQATDVDAPHSAGEQTPRASSPLWGVPPT
ncbi:uncharacterized protein B0H18DRAFT_1120398 [Fomitopsis serialis]|uniref:uncharacterized protein n=1 Tax=Fomitopsis serialis TaxID=139415 RepID=UPI002008E26C|nr:uncharacterized protein B0H18DRAFT_1120398 [Neoantrodia serialis]KAH9923552.1 hypothetical protein B0H18DRAFT_1120398 [Neoantrodia serialis]